MTVDVILKGQKVISAPLLGMLLASVQSKCREKKKKILDGTPTFCFHSCHIVSRQRALVIMQNGSYMKETPLSDLESIKPKCDVSCAGTQVASGCGGGIKGSIEAEEVVGAAVSGSALCDLSLSTLRRIANS